MKNKKLAIIAIILVLVVVAIICVITFNTPKNRPEDVLNSYISMVNEKNYEGLYSLISNNSKQNINEEDFLSRNKNIYEGIDAVNIKIEIEEISDDGGSSKVKYKETMDTTAGKIEFENITTLRYKKTGCNHLLQPATNILN